MRTISPYRSGRSPDWLKSKNPACEAVRREAEEDWGKECLSERVVGRASAEHRCGAKAPRDGVDPVRTGFVASLSRPGGNVTGVVIVPDPVGAGFVDSLARPGGNATGFVAYECWRVRVLEIRASTDYCPL
jgi:hypothetical protein